ncbi:MAG: hypothetical protein AAF330_07080 [Pseudomonadota bacterium]
MNGLDTDQKRAAAIKCVISTAAHLTMSVTADSNDRLWRETLSDALDQAGECPVAARPLFALADEFAHAAAGPPRESARTRLKLEVRKYFLATAAHASERLRRLVHSEQVR